MFFANEQSGDNGQWTISFKRLARKAFLEDWPMKLIALVVSLALWFIVSGETGKGTLTVPLNLRTAENTEFSNTPVQEVEIVVTGDKRKIDRLAEIKGALAIYRDLTDLPVGDSVIELNPANVRIDLPAGVRLTDIRPGRIAVRLEAILERDIPVKAETTGSVPEGMEIYEETVRVVPQKIRVRGPASYMKTLEFVSTEKIDVENKSGDLIAKQVAVTVSNPKVRLQEVVADVAFYIGEKRVAKTLSIPAKDGPAGKKIEVEFYGARSLLDTLRPGDLKAETVKNDAGEDVPKVDLPPELQGRIEVRKPAVRQKGNL
jgi:YbbR domain-containing protein